MVAARAGQLFDKAFHAEKSGRPYLDGIEFTIIRDMSTANLAFIAGSDNGQIGLAWNARYLNMFILSRRSCSLSLLPVRHRPDVIFRGLRALCP
jgi:hypothetical protein